MGAHQSASEAVIEAVSRRAGIDPLELEPPLFDAIDSDELDVLLDGAGRTDRSPVEITFRYHGYTVTVDHNLNVTFEE